MGSQHRATSPSGGLRRIFEPTADSIPGPLAGGSPQARAWRHAGRLQGSGGKGARAKAEIADYVLVCRNTRCWRPRRGASHIPKALGRRRATRPRWPCVLDIRRTSANLRHRQADGCRGQRLGIPQPGQRAPWLLLAGSRSWHEHSLLDTGLFLHGSMVRESPSPSSSCFRTPLD